MLSIHGVLPDSIEPGKPENKPRLMKWQKGVIGGIATASVVIIVICLIMPMMIPSNQSLVGYDTSGTWYLTSSNDYMDYIGATFQRSGEKWHVDFTASASINAYLMDETTFYDSLSCHCIAGWIQKVTGTSGVFDFTISTPGNYMIMFVGTSYTTVHFTTVEYRYPS